MNNTSPR
ncbi:hypothetical protein D049_1653A, partial [Vibrio parahaemolyticus VPTS-2010]